MWEAMFIGAVNAHRDGVPGRLAREILAFTQEEVIHSREHVVFNKKAAEAGYDLSELEDDVNQVLDLIKTRPQIVNLMATIALEHYTAMMASVMLRADSMYAGAEPAWAALWKDRMRVVWGQGVTVRVDLGGRRIIKKKKYSRKQGDTRYR